MTTITAPPTTTTSAPAVQRLRTVLRVNAATSLVAGTVGLLATDSVVDELGVQSAGWTRLISAGLVLFAIDVVLGARSARHLANTALLTSVLDLAWVVATVAVLATVGLTGPGRFLAVVLGFAVLDFAVLQLWLRGRMPR
ncbi:MAG TPA: hypothetical protein DCS55_16535 [Acidimicrobiaceae bacterium]|nr:hypothetical protein [Acidimicrobiaceae bacterium]